jgi:ABC-type dipeptide/oligopeptide/nickel transport system permease subunit
VAAQATAAKAPTVLQARRRSFSRIGWIGAALLAALLAVFLLPEQIAPYDPAVSVGSPLAPPNALNALGTNDVGQDLFSELVWGARVSLSIGVLAALLALGLALLVGIVAAYFGGWTDTILMRLVDLMLVIPVFPLLLLVAIYVGPGPLKTVWLIGLLSWAESARVFRSQALAVRGSEYVNAAHAVGVPDRRIMTRYLLPAVLPMAVGQFALLVSRAILVEAGLSFLGLGDPTQKSWGAMLYFARAGGAYLTRAWRWWVLPPGLMISVTTLGFAFVGYALEEWLDPTLQR